jgi:hypothetical protein
MMATAGILTAHGQMNLKDGGKNRHSMGVLGLAGLQTVLTGKGLWHDGMRRDEARDVLWRTNEVMQQRSRIEQLCFENGICVAYESKAHPIFNPTEVPLAKLLIMSSHCSFGVLVARGQEGGGEPLQHP